MDVDLIVSQGRIADRTPGAIPGADLIADAISLRFGLTRTDCGRPSPPRQDDWPAALSEAGTVLAELGQAVRNTLRQCRLPFVVANTCSASIATLPALLSERSDTVVLWIDAHGDFNTPGTTQSGYLGGMALSAACGLWQSGQGDGLRSNQVVLVGARDIDIAEAQLLVDAGVSVIEPEAATPQAIAAAVGHVPVWLHIDWDVLQPGIIPAAYSVPGGLSVDMMKDIIAAIPRKNLVGIELAEFEASGDRVKDDRWVNLIADVVAVLLED